MVRITRAGKQAISAAVSGDDGYTKTVVCYYRKSPASKDCIEASIEQQQKEARELCRRNRWKILEEYTDGGKSGSRDQEKRTELHRLIADAKRGDFQAVVVWHTNRFARLNIFRLAKYVEALLDAGIHFESVRQGHIDPATPEGRMALFMYAEQDSAHSLNVSADSIRGRDSRLDEGYWPHGAVPYGFSREYLEAGQVVYKAGRLAQVRKARTWRLRLVINEDEAKTVRWVYETFAGSDISARFLCAELCRRQVPNPTNDARGWEKSNLMYILRNPAYYGACEIGRQASINRNRESFNRAKRRIVPDRCPPIISQELWDRVQRKIEGRKLVRRNVQPQRASTLSGVLVCGHCGHNLDKKVRKGHVIYYCPSPYRRPQLGCHQWGAHETDILPEVCRFLVESVDFELVQSLRAKPEEQKPADLQRIKREIDDLEKRIKRGGENFLLAPPELVPQLQSQLLTWKRELEGKRNALDLVESKPSETDVAVYLRWWQGVKDRLVTVKAGKPVDVINGRVKIADLLGVVSVRAEPQTVRDILHRLKCRVTCHWKPNGKRFFTLDRAVLTAELGPDAIPQEDVLAIRNITPCQKVIRVERVITFQIPTRFRVRGRDPVTGRIVGKPIRT